MRGIAEGKGNILMPLVAKTSKERSRSILVVLTHGRCLAVGDS